MKRHLQPLEYETHDVKTHVCKLKKALYEISVRIINPPLLILSIELISIT